MKEYLKLLTLVLYFVGMGVTIGYFINHRIIRNDDINDIIYFLPTILTVVFLWIVNKYFID